MGLDTTHNAWHGPYSSFNQFRRWLSNKIGFNLDEMAGFKGERSWGSLPPDDLHILLNHSDCDGEISAADCARIAVRLDEVVESINLASTNPFSSDDAYYVSKARQFSDGCKLAAEADETLGFH